MRQQSLASEVASRLLEAGGTMSDHIHDSRSVELPDQAPQFTYPWAAAPDIIRANQKDAYFQSVLLTHLSSVLRSLYGARSAHNWTTEARTFTELLYLGLTTLVGNRTLGEEYCDIVQVEDDNLRLPALARRAGYILSSVLLPYLLNRWLPALRGRLRAKLDTRLRKSHRRRASSPSRSLAPHARAHHLQEYVLKHLDTLTSPAPVHALGLTLFYFSGAYYQLSKRLLGLRYIFTRADPAADAARPGYEVLGVLLVLQLAVQAYLHVHATYRGVQMANQPAASVDAASADTSFASPLLFEAPHTADPTAQREHLARVTHTPLPEGGGGGGGDGRGARYDLADEAALPWLAGRQARRCTLCLEPMRDPSATTCGHVFCWTCVTDWLREQPMCPLCRQAALVQHVLPLRG